MSYFSRFKNALLVLVGLVGATGCSQMKVTQFAGQEPRFIPEQYFLGEGVAQGVFFDRFGNLKRSFYLTLSGRMEDGVLILDEQLRYDDGEEVSREYRIKKKDEHNYTVTSEAFDGEATIQSYGNVLNWNYVLKQEIKGEIWHLTFDDWMFLQEDGVVLNRAYATKFGFDVGEVFLTFRKTEDSKTTGMSDAQTEEER